MSTTETWFWVVWNPQGRAPTVRHHSRAFADAEATRLARIAPGHRFFVLKAVGGFVLPAGSPQSIDLEPPEKGDGIPF